MPHARGRHRCHCHHPFQWALQHNLLPALLLLLRLALVLQTLLLLAVGVAVVAAGPCPHS
jgi:hypothetical protein